MLDSPARFQQTLPQVSQLTLAACNLLIHNHYDSSGLA